MKNPTPWLIATLALCLIAGVCYGIAWGCAGAVPYFLGFADGAVVTLFALITIYIRGKRRAVQHG